MYAYGLTLARYNTIHGHAHAEGSTLLQLFLTLPMHASKRALPNASMFNMLIMTRVAHPYLNLTMNSALRLCSKELAIARVMKFLINPQ